MKSCVYAGAVRHRRLEPVPHAFRFRLFMMYLDLDELPHLFDARWFWSARGPAFAWFRREDYLGDPAVPLDQAVRDLVFARTGYRPAGPIRVLTHPRYFGFVMNPVSFYYCYNAADSAVETIVAEVTNTPWNERHAYVLRANPSAPAGATVRADLTKMLHVSPFMSMESRYDWRFSQPGDRLAVCMTNLGADGKTFDATLALHREELTGPVLARMLATYPWMTAKVAIGIYWQALRLKLKGAPVYDHPGKSNVAIDVAR